MSTNARAGPSGLRGAPDTQSPASSSPSSKDQPTNRLYVGNLAPSVDEYALVQVFQRYGKLTKLDFMYHKTGTLKGKPRGYAFVEMQSVEDAQKAMIKLHERLLRGRKLVVTSASSAPPENAPLPAGTRGRRSEPAKQTTLSLLKSKQKPTSAAAQIAAMEAKLATMQSRKPADEDWVPGQVLSHTGSGIASAASDMRSREGSAAILGDQAFEEGGIGEEEGRRAAEDLEREMADMIASSALPAQDGQVATGAGAGPSRGQADQQVTEGTETAEKRSIPKGLPESLPAKPPPPPPSGLAALPRKPTLL